MYQCYEVGISCEFTSKEAMRLATSDMHYVVLPSAIWKWNRQRGCSVDDHKWHAVNRPDFGSWARLVPKNFQLEICDFHFRHMHGALNVIK